MKEPSHGPSAQSGFSAWKQSALFGFVSMELKVHTLLHLLCHQWEEHKRRWNLFWEGIRIICIPNKNASSETMSLHCVRNEIKKKFNVTYIFDPNMPWSKLGFFYNFLYQSHQSIWFLIFWRCLEPALFYWNCIGPHRFNCDISLLKWKHFSFFQRNFF